MESLKSYDIDNGKLLYESYDSAYVHQSLEQGFLARLLGYKDVKRISHRNNHDGTRTIIMYLSNRVKLVYTIKA